MTRSCKGYMVDCKNPAVKGRLFCFTCAGRKSRNKKTLALEMFERECDELRARIAEIEPELESWKCMALKLQSSEIQTKNELYHLKSLHNKPMINVQGSHTTLYTANNGVDSASSMVHTTNQDPFKPVCVDGQVVDASNATGPPHASSATTPSGMLTLLAGATTQMDDLVGSMSTSRVNRSKSIEKNGDVDCNNRCGVVYDDNNVTVKKEYEEDALDESGAVEALLSIAAHPNSSNLPTTRIPAMHACSAPSKHVVNAPVEMIKKRMVDTNTVTPDRHVRRQKTSHPPSPVSTSSPAFTASLPNTTQVTPMVPSSHAMMGKLSSSSAAAVAAALWVPWTIPTADMLPALAPAAESHLTCASTPPTSLHMTMPSTPITSTHATHHQQDHHGYFEQQIKQHHQHIMDMEKLRYVRVPMPMSMRVSRRLANRPRVHYCEEDDNIDRVKSPGVSDDNNNTTVYVKQEDDSVSGNVPVVDNGEDDNATDATAASDDEVSVSQAFAAYDAAQALLSVSVITA